MRRPARRGSLLRTPPATKHDSFRELWLRWRIEPATRSIPHLRARGRAEKGGDSRPLASALRSPAAAGRRRVRQTLPTRSQIDLPTWASRSCKSPRPLQVARSMRSLHATRGIPRDHKPALQSFRTLPPAALRSRVRCCPRSKVRHFSMYRILGPQPIPHTPQSPAASPVPPREALLPKARNRCS